MMKQLREIYHSEYSLQVAVTKYLKFAYPNLIFRSDLGGVRLSRGLAIKMKKIQWSSGYPDLFIAQRNKKWGGLFLELKTKTPYKKNGDLKKCEHLEKQSQMLKNLNERGYYATFSTGFEEAKKIIDWYARLH